MTNINTNVTDRIASRIGLTDTEIFAASDFPAPSGGEILLPSGTYILKNSVTISDTLLVAPGAIVEFIALGFGSTITYDGTGTALKSVSGSFVVMRNMNVVLTGVGSQLFDVTSDSLIISQFLASFQNTGQSIGVVTPLTVGMSLQNLVILGFSSGLVVQGSILFQAADITMTADAGNTGPVFDLASGLGEIDITNVTITAGAAGSAIDITPGFVGTANIERVRVPTGAFFDPGSLDETDPHVNVVSSPPQKPSFSIGSVIATDNPNTTTISVQGTFVDLDLNASAVLGSNAELWSLSGAMTGELTYNGLTPFFGNAVAAITAISSGGTREFQFRVVKNGSVLPDGVLAAAELGGNAGSITLIAPITASPGDTVRLQVANVDDTSDVTIQQLSMQVS